MRYIHKGEGNETLKALHANPPQNSEEAKNGWDAFFGEAKWDTRNRCHLEQSGLCGYSEIVLLATDSRGFAAFDAHLEHVEPKSQVPQRTFDHSNLILSAIKNKGQAGIVKEDLFGGHHKDNWHEPEHFITPFMSDCAAYFFYKDDGQIAPNMKRTPVEQENARKTIEKLNLNSKVLVPWRRNWYNETELNIKELLDSGKMDELKDFAKKTLAVNNHVLNPFHSMLRQLFGKFADPLI